MKLLKLSIAMLTLAAATLGAGAQPSRIKHIDGTFGYVDAENQPITTTRYSCARLFHDGLAMVCYGGKSGYIDEHGKVVIPMKFDEARDFSDGWAAVRMGMSWGYIDRSGRLMQSEYISTAGNSFFSRITSALDFNNGMAGISVGGKWGFVNRTGKTVIKPQYDDVNSFNDGMAAVVADGKVGFIDRYNNLIIPMKYSGGSYFGFDGTAVRDAKSGRCGLIDADGRTVVPFVYDDCYAFYNSLAAVCTDGKWGYIDTTGRMVVNAIYDWVDWRVENGMAIVLVDKQYGVIDSSGNVMLPIVCDYLTADQFRRDVQNPVLMSNYKQLGFDVFARNYVTRAINAWQKKDQFESTAEFRARVNESTRNAKVAELTAEARKRYIDANTAGFQFEAELGTYDADNEVFLVEESHYGQLLLPVPRSEARRFSADWGRVRTVEPVFFIEDNAIGLAELSFRTPDGKQYRYSNSASLNYAVADIDYNFDPIELPEIEQAVQRGTQTITQTTVKVGKADIDTDIPRATAANDLMFAVIIANEEYQAEQPVPYAINDGNSFRLYCEQTLGIPSKNIRFVRNATLNNIRQQVNWVGQVAESFDGRADIVFYYAGHGIPDESNGTSFLLPVDGVGSDPATGYKVDDLFTSLGTMPARRITVFMDACFSGSKRDGGMLASARGVAIKAKQGRPKGNMVVFCASQNDETAFPYVEKGHGMFTYYLLKKLQTTGGDVTLGELGSYVSMNVKQQSLLVNNKSQTPSVSAAAGLGTDWQGWRLK